MESILSDVGALYNEDHAHLLQANVGVVWTSVPYRRQMRGVIGMAEMPGQGSLSGWRKARAEQQLEEWFGLVPDFLVTLYAPFCEGADDATFCALVEHELYHCAQAVNEFGAPRFSRATGRPIYTLRGHDVEEFVGVVRRYGARATGASELVRAANAGPQVAPAAISGACGTQARGAA